MNFGLPQWIVLAVALFRVAELILAQRNTKRLLANGGSEFGRRHYPLFVLLHGGWLLVLFFDIPSSTELNHFFFGILWNFVLWTSLGYYSFGPLLDDKGNLVTRISTHSQGSISICASSELLGCYCRDRGFAAVFRCLVLGSRFFVSERCASMVAYTDRK